MVALTVRNLDDETVRALRMRAAESKRSVEAELRVIIGIAVMPAGRLLMGSTLAVIGRTAGGLDLLPKLKDSAPDEPA